MPQSRPLLRFAEWLARLLRLPTSSKLVVYATVVGIFAGGAAIAFDFGAQWMRHWTAAKVAGFSPADAAGEHARFVAPTTPLRPLVLIVVVTCGGLASGWIVWRWAPEAAGAGTGAAIEAFHNHRGEVRRRIPLVKFIASIITLGTGGSGGREGPIAQIGAGLGSWLGRRFGLPARDRRILLAAGMGAGVGALFRAPLAGAVFAGEILYADADLEADALVPAATSSVIAYSLYTQTLPTEVRFQPLFGAELLHSFHSPVELLPYGLLGVVLVIAGMAYVHCFRAAQRLFDQTPIPRFTKPALGAALAAIVAVGATNFYGSPQVLYGALGTGYGSLQVALHQASAIGIPLLLLLAAAKAVTTSLTISSGGSGGIFGPSMVIGGSVGAVVGLTLQRFAPSLVHEPEAYAVVGMAGFFAGVARAPLSTIIMVRALTGDFGLLAPTMLVTTMTFVMSRRWMLYETQQVPTRLDSPAHRGDLIVDVLEGLKVEDVYERELSVQNIPEAMTLDEIVHLLACNQQHYFPVVNRDDQVVGIFTDDDIRVYLFDDKLWKIVLASDLMIEGFLYVTPEDDLNTALMRFTTKNLDELPVIDPASGKLLSMLRRKAVIAAYNRKLLDHKTSVAAQA